MRIALNRERTFMAGLAAGSGLHATSPRNWDGVTL